MTTHEENPVLEKQRQAEEIIAVLDRLANTRPTEGEKVREDILRTAREFTKCIEEGFLLEDAGVEEGGLWHERETEAHEAFIVALKTLRDTLGEDSPRALADLSHLSTNALAMHIAQISAHADKKHAA